MLFSTLKPAFSPSPFSLPTVSLRRPNSVPRNNLLKPTTENSKKTRSLTVLRICSSNRSNGYKSVTRFQKSDHLSSCSSCSAIAEPEVRMLEVADKVRCLACEFGALPNPVDKVRRLLHYAAILPPFDELARVEENRVTGCTTQVWLDVRMNGEGLMRFQVDSDSEITKGFCSCLIWLLDGAAPQEVLSLRTEDLAEINVGLPSRGKSRVNTWHNVLISMQKRTQNFLEESDRRLASVEFSSLIGGPDAISVVEVARNLRLQSSEDFRSDMEENAPAR